MEQTIQDKLLEIKQKATERNLYIRRVPKKTREEFINWCDEEFEGDWGFGLKWLMDFRKGLLETPESQLLILEKIDILANEIEQLKKKEDKPQKRRMLSGKILGKQMEEKNEQAECVTRQTASV